MTVSQGTLISHYYMFLKTLLHMVVLDLYLHHFELKS
jgi:hypothetical protein